MPPGEGELSAMPAGGGGAIQCLQEGEPSAVHPGGRRRSAMYPGGMVSEVQ